MHTLYTDQWVSNVVIMFASRLWIIEQLEGAHRVDRHYLCPTYMTKVIHHFVGVARDSFVESVFDYFYAEYEVFNCQWISDLYS
ncbi:hypothetical protein NMG60_11028834 [Bertholletia excelsa]